MKQIEISNEEIITLKETMKIEREFSLEMLKDNLEKLDDTKNKNEIFEWIEFSIFNYNLYDKLHKIFTETETNGKDLILKIK
jgi:ABC-type uncharacterized transport system substrate-binding protein